MMPELLNGLNEQQERAVITTAPVILCIAGAGSGKTTVLTKRVANLVLNHGIKTSNILCLTFTRLAGLEMKERVIKLIGEDAAKELFSNTFDAFAVSVLKEHGHLLGIEENFSIYDQEDRNELFKKIIADLGNRTTLSKVVERHKKCGDVREERRAYPEECRVLEEYGYRCKQNNAVDLNRLVDLVIRLWELHPTILAHYQNQYSHVFVDEFQDTDKEQAYMVDLLRARNLFIVGDADQSIYEWRGAKVDFIVNFEKNNPGCEVIKLEDNYRSTEQIVDVANRLIRFNVKRVDKKLIAHKFGCAVSLDRYEDAYKENAAVADSIAAMSQDMPYKEIAVLARTNAKLDSIKWELERRGLPCLRVGGQEDPYKAPMVKRIIDWMYFMQNNADDMAFKRVFKNFAINSIKMAEIELYALNMEVSLCQASLKFSVGQVFFESASLPINEAISKVEDSPLAHVNAIRNVIVGSQSEVDRAIPVIERWQASKQRVNEDYSVKAFLKHLRFRDIQEKLTEKKDAINLMTIHGSKGLEFDTVYLVGMNQGVFPSKRGEIEEERRLAYVAATRAKNRLHLTYADAVSDWSGNMVNASPSQFLDEFGLD
ncbi:DNA helicase-2/ATP-dependent DNA helicase PcrA [Anaerospora hongkongensis]|uniref:DNA 3'-5' helicase n=1 Tax=Anaerospora hongkongensis TaxID=244830 RepID=A0A4R1Q2I6_9FIRM|nr:ATP-dependent helicase [Anaerospora hongkongensis]TCL40027.1 DNA helicase-2/ATP-dependent DNA helicase PcrA [Anaerospora hongkongensis]